MNPLRVMRSARFAIGRGARGIIQAPFVSTVAIATISVCMLLLGLVLLVWTNARGVADAWGVEVPITAYLVDAAEPGETESLAERLRSVPGVESVIVVDGELAMSRLRAGLGGDPTIIEGITADLVPPSLELQLQPDLPQGFEATVVDRLAELPLVEEVAVAGEWVGQARAMLRTLRDLAWGAGLFVGFVCVAIVGSTIRLGVHARRHELEILRLCGGTAAFVRGPFMVEGLVQGLVGSAIALAGLWFGFDGLRPFVEGGLSLVFAVGSLRFFTPLEMALGIGFGAFVGLLGARAASASYEGP